MINELNKRANLLIEQLEVITFSLFLPFLLFSQLWIYMWRVDNSRDVIRPESKQTRTHDNLSKLLKQTPRDIHLSKRWLCWVSQQSSHDSPWTPVIILNQMNFYGFSSQKISDDFQQHLVDQLQGAIEICGQLDHVQKFITWALTHHCRGPVLFSRALVRWQDRQYVSTVSLQHTLEEESQDILIPQIWPLFWNLLWCL